MDIFLYVHKVLYQFIRQVAPHLNKDDRDHKYLHSILKKSVQQFLTRRFLDV